MVLLINHRKSFVETNKFVSLIPSGGVNLVICSLGRRILHVIYYKMRRGHDGLDWLKHLFIEATTYSYPRLCKSGLTLVRKATLLGLPPAYLASLSKVLCHASPQMEHMKGFGHVLSLGGTQGCLRRSFPCRSTVGYRRPKTVRPKTSA